MPARRGKPPSVRVDAPPAGVRNGTNMTDPTTSYHWLRLDDRLTTSGQPTEAEVAALAALGVRCVINLAPHSNPRTLPDEPASVAALGMEYLDIPVDFASPTEADFTAFAAAMNARAGQVAHVHCAANDRVSAFLLRYRRDVLGMPASAAGSDLDRIWTRNLVWAAFIARSPAP